MILALWGPRKPPSPPPATLEARVEDPALEARVEELEDQYRRLTRRFDRLQGEFSALVRYADEEDNEDAVE